MPGEGWGATTHIPALRLPLEDLQVQSLSQANISGKNPSSWQKCCKGPQEFQGASECLIANWLNQRA